MQRMRNRTVLLIVTALCWGTSFAFMKIAVRELSPAALMSLRCGIGMLILWPVAWRIGGSVSLPRRDHVALWANGAMTAAPFLLIAWGVHRIDSGIAGIVNASVPLWSVLLTLRWDAQHRTGAGRIAGVLVGFAGVVLLLATRGTLAGHAASFAIVACATGALLYAVSGVFVRERLSQLSAPVVAAWSITWAAIILAVPAAFGPPVRHVTAEAAVALLLLGVLGTGIGMLAYYQLLAVGGAARAALVTYLLPPLAVVWGAILLGEALRVDAVAAMVLILAGVWLASREGPRTR